MWGCVNRGRDENVNSFVRRINGNRLKLTEHRCTLKLVGFIGCVGGFCKINCVVRVLLWKKISLVPYNNLKSAET